MIWGNSWCLVLFTYAVDQRVLKFIIIWLGFLLIGILQGMIFCVYTAIYSGKLKSILADRRTRVPASIWAPRSSSTPTQSTWSPWALMCSGVSRLFERAFTLAERSTNAMMTESWPLRAAQCSGVNSSYTAPAASSITLYSINYSWNTTIQQ